MFISPKFHTRQKRRDTDGRQHACRACFAVHMCASCFAETIRHRTRAVDSQATGACTQVDLVTMLCCMCAQVGTGEVIMRTCKLQGGTSWALVLGSPQSPLVRSSHRRISVAGHNTTSINTAAVVVNGALRMVVCLHKTERQEIRRSKARSTAC